MPLQKDLACNLMTTSRRSYENHRQSEKHQIQAKADEEQADLEWKQERLFNQRRSIIAFL
jgi:hypothetical protein